MGGLPVGSRDRLPAACRRRRRLTSALLEAFERWGYAEAMTPVVEFYDVLARGLSEADRRAVVRFIEAGTGAVVALRSDLTPQIARMVASRRGDDLSPGRCVRLCYAADVVRQPSGPRGKTELHQAGVELIGDADPAVDAELVALVHAAMHAAGLTSFRIDLSHRQVAAAVIEAAATSAQDRDAIASLLARKDRAAVEAWMADHGAPTAVASAAAELCDLYGSAEVLARAPDRLGRLAGSGLERLQAVLAVLEAVAPAAHADVSVDLGETRGFDYYTGLRLRVWAPGVAEPVVRGGRYDDLLARYGASAPAVGFAVDLDALEAARRHAHGQWCAAMPGVGHLVALAAGADTASGRRRAMTMAARARETGARAWTLAGLDLPSAQAAAAGDDATALTFIDDGGEVREFRRAPGDENAAWESVGQPVEQSVGPET